MRDADMRPMRTRSPTMDSMDCLNCERHKTLRVAYLPVPDVRFYKCGECGYIPLEGKTDIAMAWEVWSVKNAMGIKDSHR